MQDACLSVTQHEVASFMACPAVILELPVPWFHSPLDGARHQQFYVSIWQALAEMGVTVQPRILIFGADEAPRLGRHDQLIISFHSRGPAGSVLRIKESYLPPYYTVDRMGYSGFSELAIHPERFATAITAASPAKAQDFVEALKRQMVADNLSKYSQEQPRYLSLPDPYVFMPLQTVDDPVAALSDIDQLDALDALLSAAEALGWGVVVKRHPLCRSEKIAAALDRLAARHPHMQRSDASVHQLISGAQAVIGANSGVLFEALVHGAHVVSFGASDFRIATTSVTRPQDIAAAIAGRGRVTRADQCAFLFWYLTRYCLRADDVAGIRDRIADALAALDQVPDQVHQQQKQLFEDFARREQARRRALRGE